MVGDLVLLFNKSDFDLAPRTSGLWSLFSTLFVDLFVVLNSVFDPLLLADLLLLLVEVLLFSKSESKGCVFNDGFMTCFPASTLASDLLLVETKLEEAAIGGFDADIAMEDRLVRASFSKGDLFLGTRL